MIYQPDSHSHEFHQRQTLLAAVQAVMDICARPWYPQPTGTGGFASGTGTSLLSLLWQLIHDVEYRIEAVEPHPTLVAERRGDTARFNPYLEYGNRTYADDLPHRATLIEADVTICELRGTTHINEPLLRLLCDLSGTMLYGLVRDLESHWPELDAESTAIGGFSLAWHRRMEEETASTDALSQP